jgi:nicotinamidase-related amidase
MPKAAKNETLPEDRRSAALLVIDVQRELFAKSTPIYQAERLLQNINSLVDRAHKASVPVFYVQHSAERYLVLGSEGWQLHPQMGPTEADGRVHKKHGSAFEGTDLGEELAKKKVGHVVVCGLVTHGCVRATTLDALRLGYRVTLVRDGHSSYSKQAAAMIEQWNDKLQEAGALLQTAAEVDFLAQGGHHVVRV